MITLKFESDDIRKLAEHLGEYGRKVKRKASFEIERTGMDMIRTAKRDVPRDTGHLRRSLEVLSRKKLSLVIGTVTYYAIWQEQKDKFKHPKGGRAHYLQRAYEQHRPELIERLTEILKDARS